MNFSLPKVSFNFLLSFVFVGVFLVFGGFISVYQYQKTAQILYSKSADLQNTRAQKVIDNFQLVYKPIATNLNFLETFNLENKKNLAQILLHLKQFVYVLNSLDNIFSLQFAYLNGDYFIIRKLSKINNSLFLKEASPPNKSVYLVDYLKQDQKELTRIFLDKNLNILDIKKSNSSYDPRKRDWYVEALKSDKTIVTKPYSFYFTKDVGLTIARFSNKKIVLSADINLKEIYSNLSNTQFENITKSLLFLDDKTVLASSGLNKKQENLANTNLNNISDNLIKSLKNKLFMNKKQGFIHEFDGIKWFVRVQEISFNKNIKLNYAIFSPLKTILSDAFLAKKQILFFTFFLIIFSFPIIIYASFLITKRLKILEKDALDIKNFKFKNLEFNTKIKELEQLKTSMNLLKNQLSLFLEMLKKLETSDFKNLIHILTFNIAKISGAKLVSFHLFDLKKPNDLILEALSKKQTLKYQKVTKLNSYEKNELKTNKSSLFSINKQIATSFYQEILKITKTKELIVYQLPIYLNNKDLLGFISIFYQKNSKLNFAVFDFIKTLLPFIKVALKNTNLINSQQKMFDSFVKAMAYSIDAKSPYTAEHCQRVPKLSEQIAKSISKSKDKKFKTFKLDKKNQQIMHIASWLHDCGKIITPTHIMDKSTKLETIYDRLHEIRTRFEVVKRDLEIQELKDFIKEKKLSYSKSEEFIRKMTALDDDYYFLAKMNIGQEQTSNQMLEKVNQISNIKWQRTLDDKYGIDLSIDFIDRTKKIAIEENVIADKNEHLISLKNQEFYKKNNKWNFNVTAPKYSQNLGEIYNLCIKSGTLTKEERHIINEHVVLSIVILESLLYPKELNNVAKIAGSHHEKLNGQGYPRGLDRNHLSIGSRIIAIADVFEALSASDRPYKRAKKLSQIFNIMQKMADDEHLDQDILKVFIEQKIYLKFAKQYLKPWQIDI